MSENPTPVQEAHVATGAPAEDEDRQPESVHDEVERTQSRSSSEPEGVSSKSRQELDEEKERPIFRNIPEPADYLPYEERPLHSQVRYYNYEGFMNRMQGDKGDFVIEVLVAKPDLTDEIMTEKGRRAVPQLPPPPLPIPASTQQPQLVPPPQSSVVAYPPRPPPRVPRYIPTREVHPSQQHAFQDRLKLPEGSEIPPDGRIMRIRVGSNIVLRTLASVSDCQFLSHNNDFEFERPFRILEDTYTNMKLRLTEMEDQDSDSNTADSVDDSQPHQAAIADVVLEQAHIVERQENSASQFTDNLNHMRCYVNFIEKTVLPIRENLLSSGESHNPRVCFQDIPYLFKPGSLVFLPQQRKSGKPLHRSAAQQVWRMVSCEPAAVYTSFRRTDEEDPCKFTQWSMYCLDYDGDSIIPIWHVAKFERFAGEREITSLECYPLDFHPNRKRIIDSHKSIGHLFKSSISAKLKHHYYSGWTFITGLHAEPLDDENGDRVQYPEYIESEIVIDFKETLRSYPKWETDAGENPLRKSGYNFEDDSEVSYQTWGKDIEPDLGRRRHREDEVSILTEEAYLYQKAAETWIAQDDFLLKKVDFLPNTWSDADLVLLPRRLFAYILRERKFARIDVEGIELNTGDSKVNLDHIQMKPERRRMIRSAVSAHFKDKKGPSTFDLDLIRGKGRGLVILLHGAPGVGKTATAEAVAAETRRPLFPITCGDLGFSPNAVDKSLRDIFRYAHLWNCILLLDEADVFLTQRDRGGGNLERNALVGVFLKVLEYYSGILFLTTNRVGALDEAFQSRVHLSLSYPNLSLEDTVKILEANLSRLPRVERAANNTPRDGYLKVNDKAIIEFVSSEYKRYAERTGKDRGPWNGRQIRNAVQIAAGLALYDKQTEVEEKGEDGIPAFLTTDHFRAVAETTAEFEQYLEVTNVGDNETRAKRRQDRADHFRMKRDHDDSQSDDERKKNPPRASYRGSSPETEHMRSGEHVPGSRWSGMSRRTRQPPPQRSRMSGRDYVTASTSFDRETGRGPPRSHGGQAPRRPREDCYEDEHYEQADDLQEYDQEEALEDEEYERGHHPRRMAHRGKPESSQVGRGKY